MKIAMISLYLPSGSKIGSGYQAHYMANAMVRRGHCVTMFSPCAHSEGALYETVTVSVGEKLRTFRFAWNLRKIDFSGFDVVHAHGDDYWLFGKPRGIHVRTMHGSCLAEAFHVPGCFEKLRMLLLGISEVIATLVSGRTVCVSRNTLRHYPWLRHVIVNGVDTAEFRPTNELAANPTILFVGTYHNRKRGKLLMEHFAQVIQPALPNAELWMVCRDAPAAPGVRVFGSVPLDELADLFRRAWVFCLPSSYEGFGVPYIEAMASGTPVVATPNVGACEVLRDGEFGAIVEPEQLGTVILALLNDASRRAELRRKGLDRSRDFAWDNVVSQYEECYAELADRRNCTAGMATAR
jgi:glycosyltransferase involved in cell wall biosynthesis